MKSMNEVIQLQARLIKVRLPNVCYIFTKVHVILFGEQIILEI